MPVLPARPSLEHLRRETRDLQRAHRRGEPDAITLVAEVHPAPPSGPLPLTAAQLVVARRYGFPSWPRLVAHLAVVAEHQRVHAALAGGADPAATFLDLACLIWSDDDGPHRWAAAREVLAGHPELGGPDRLRGVEPAPGPGRPGSGGPDREPPRQGVVSPPSGPVAAALAAVLADPDRLAALVAADPALATTECGPRRWAPLMYLACARHDPDVPRDAVLACARQLLVAGAEPNTGYLFDGLPTPFTALTGAFGGGERDQPPHPHADALAGLLLVAGADPNDGQALYNRMFSPDDSHLRLLLAHGLGAGDGGPWHRRMPDATDDPATMLREQLVWAAAHGFDDRIRLLAAHGVDLVAPLRGGRTATTLAAVAGRPATVEVLVSLGAAPPDLPPAEALLAAALAVDGDAVRRIRAAHPEALREARRTHPGAVVRAAAARNVAAVRLLVRLGFPVDGMGRADLPIDQKWETALHEAAGNGDDALVEALLELGADRTVHDRRFDTTPAGWARHFGHDDLADRLEGP